MRGQMAMGGWKWFKRRFTPNQPEISDDVYLGYCLASDTEKIMYERMKACFLASMDPNVHQGILIKVAIERYQSVALLDLIKQFGGNLDLPIHQGLTALEWVVSDCVCQQKYIAHGDHWERRVIDFLLESQVNLDEPIDASHLDSQGLNGKSARELLEEVYFESHP